jgi:diphthamide biosynthesis protein 2
VLQAAAAAAAGADGGEEARFSLLDGAYHGDEEAEEGSSEVQGEVTALALRAQQALTVAAAPAGGGHLVQPRSAADFFVHKRSWTGVEAPIVGAEAKAVERAVPGRSGRAAGYADEPGR